MRTLHSVNVRVRRRVRASLGAHGRSSRGAVVRAYIALAKPRIIELLLVTTVPSMILAERGVPSLWLILAVLVGGVHRKIRTNRTTAGQPTVPVTAAHPTRTGTAPAAPPMTMFCGDRRFSQTV